MSTDVTQYEMDISLLRQKVPYNHVLGPPVCTLIRSERTSSHGLCYRAIRSRVRSPGRVYHPTINNMADSSYMAADSVPHRCLTAGASPTNKSIPRLRQPRATVSTTHLRAS